MLTKCTEIKRKEDKNDSFEINTVFERGIPKSIESLTTEIKRNINGVFCRLLDRSP